MLILSIVCLGGGYSLAQRAIENPSFEENDPPGNVYYFVYNDEDVRGWQSTTGNIELWDDNFLGVPAADGKVFAEMNAHSPGNIYQTICMTNGEEVGYDFYHRARRSNSVESLTFEITDPDGNLIQVLASSSVVAANGWVQISGSKTYTGPTGFQRIQFNTTDPGSSGNLLDDINIRLSPYVRFADAGSADSEGDLGNIPKVLVAGQVPEGGMSVDVAVSGGTARAGEDYILHSSTINIPAGLYDGVGSESFFPIDIEIIDDPFIEDDESIGFNLTNVVNGTIADANCQEIIGDTSYDVVNNPDDNVPTSIVPSGFNPSPPSAGPGSASAPFAHLARAKSVTQSGRYYFDVGAGLFLADIDASEGSGWVLALQYVHQGGTNPDLEIIGASQDLPITSTSPIGSDDSSDSTRWGHAGNNAVAQFAGEIETRFYGESADHSRLIHFKTPLGGDYLKTGQGSFAGIDIDYTALTGHSSYTYLPRTTNKSFSNQGHFAFTEFPFYEGAQRHWGIKGLGHRWEVDNYYFNSTEINSPYGDDTIHRAWIRSYEVPHIDISTVSDSNAGQNASGYLQNAVPALTVVANSGDTVSFPLKLEPYVLQNTALYFDVGQTLLGGSIGKLPEGWSYEFKDAAGNPIAKLAPFETFSSSGFGDVQDVTLEVTIPANMAQSTQADHRYVIDDAGNMMIDGNNDGDGDIGVFVRARPDAVWGEYDDIFLAIDVNPFTQIEIIGSGETPIRPGGFEWAEQSVTNNGNTRDSLWITAQITTDFWTSEVFVDTTGDGVFDAPLESLSPGDTLYARAPDGALVATTLGATRSIFVPSLYSIPYAVRVFAPDSSESGSTHTMTTQVTFANGADSYYSDSQFVVTERPLKIVRSVAVDSDCDGISTSDLSPETEFSTDTYAVDPDTCIITQIVATNVGTESIFDLYLIGQESSSAPVLNGTIRYCTGDAGQQLVSSCSFIWLTDDIDDDEAELTEDGMRLIMGYGTTPTSGNELKAGQSISLRYASQIE